MYTGRISINIPLIELNDKDFNFPMSLSYDSGGFKPSVPDNFVGRNWSLISGGLIYREINGIPDDLEFKKIGSDTQDAVKGFLTVNKLYKNIINLKELEANIFSNPYLYADRISHSINLSSIPNLDDEQIESTADTYYFSFGGYSGKFMLNFDGSISSVTTLGGECSVDLSEYNLVSNTDPYTSKIKITTDNGYTYTFGGTGYGALEYTPLSWKDIFSFIGVYDNLVGHTVSAYYLTQISAPNGRKLKIFYKDINSDYHKNPYKLSYSEFTPDTKFYMQYSYATKPYILARYLNKHDNTVSGPPPNIQETLTKVALIDYIETDQVSIKFYYSERDQIPQYSNYQKRSKFPYHCGAKLDSISLCMSGNLNAVQETTRFNYEYHSGNRLFLSSVSNPKRGKHQFHYNKVTASTINPTTSNIDHWGFWRGANSNGNILPIMKVPESGTGYQEDYVVLSDDREPTGENCDATLLNEVVFPTGGSCRFEYEPNTYSERLEVHAPNFIPAFRYPPSGQKALAGGARIKTIKYYDQNKIVKQTAYEYDRNLSAGLLNFMPVYRYIQWFYYPDKKVTNSLGFVQNSDGVNYYPFGSEVLGYQFVEEKYIDYSQQGQKSKVSSKLTSFTSLSSNPDIYSVKWGIDPNAFGAFKANSGGLFGSPDAYFGPNEYVHRYNANLEMKPILNASYERGKIKSEEYYSAENKLLKSVKYDYKRIQRATVLNIYSLPIFPHTLTGTYMHIGIEQFNKYLPASRTETDYSADGNYVGKVKKELYKYNQDGYLISKQFVREASDTLETIYTYTQKQFVPPDKSTYLLSGASRKLLYEEKYKSDSKELGYWKVKKVKTGISPRLETRIEYRKYDNFGNPVHIITDNQYSTVYIWGYHGQYLIAKIENASYDDVASVMGLDPAEYSSAPQPTMYSLDFLREQLRDAQVSTYTYYFFPYIGVETYTSPSGDRVKYEYDHASRLIEIKRVSDKDVTTVLQINKYNIVNQ